MATPRAPEPRSHSPAIHIKHRQHHAHCEAESRDIVLYLAGVLESMNMRLCALLETSDGEYHICCGQFSFFRPWSLLLSNLKLRSRSLSAIMDLMRNRANFALTDSVYKLGVSHRAIFLAKIFQLPVGRPSGHEPGSAKIRPKSLCGQASGEGHSHRADRHDLAINYLNVLGEGMRPGPCLR
jgi:hypothetical protein